MKNDDEFKALMDIDFNIRESCFMTYDEYGNVRILSGIPTMEEYQKVQKQALEHAESCEKIRNSIFEAECKLIKNNKRDNNLNGYFYCLVAIIFSLLSLIIINQ